MTVKQVYEQYTIPLNLQKHMLRVAALSEILCEHWKKPDIDKKSVIYACLFHDMANIIKFDLSKPSLFKEEKDQIEYWKRIQTETINKYGTSVHDATIQICKEIGLSQKIVQLVHDLEWNNTLNALNQKDFGAAIAIYCDMRVGPFGILSLEERLKNLQLRYSITDFSTTVEFANLLEQTVQKNIDIQVNSVTESQLINRFEELLKLEAYFEIS